MIDFTPDSFGIPVVVPGERGPLNGNLGLLPGSPALAILPGLEPVPGRQDLLLAGILRHAGFSTLHAQLLAQEEERFRDIHHNVPLLARRLLEFLGQMQRRILIGELPEQAFILCATGALSPVALRVAAQRDHDIAALVCRGGLIDLAGALYLRTLASPLLLLHEQSDTAHIASNRRALREIRARRELRIIPDIGDDDSEGPGFEAAAKETLQWLTQRFGATR